MASQRFAGSVRLFGEEGFEKLRRAHVCVLGVGGVGSWAVEALARNGVGRLTLIDGDCVAETNINRQLHALTSTVGRPKVAVLAERIAEINPECAVEAKQLFLDPGNMDEVIVRGDFDFIIDAIDRVRDKACLIAFCRDHEIPIVTVGSAGGQSDPTHIEICDLARTQQEPLLAKVRKRLRAEYGFTRNIKTKFGIDAVYSSEPVSYPEDRSSLEQVKGLNPAGFGTTMAVTASFGLAAASYVLRKISGLA